MSNFITVGNVIVNADDLALIEYVEGDIHFTFRDDIPRSKASANPEEFEAFSTILGARHVNELTSESVPKFTGVKNTPKN
jgi:hypothetical protein